MITSTKSVKCILSYNIIGGGIVLLTLLIAFISDIVKQSAIQTAAYMLGYTFIWLAYIAVAICWLWANWYALLKLNKLRDEAAQLHTTPKYDSLH